MKVLKKIMLIALISLVPYLISAQDIAPGLDFLKLGIGARASAMGEAFTAVADDGSASYWNPAGLGGIKDLQFLVMHAQLPLGIRFEHLGTALPFNIGAICLSVTYLTSGEIEGRDEFGEITNPYENSDIAGGIAYGKKFGSGFQFGIGAKFIQEKIDQISGTGFGVDAGCLYEFPLGLNFGVAAQNLGTAIKLIEENTKMPLTFRAGISYTLTGSSGKIMPVFDLVLDEGVKENFGLEFIILNILALRGGYRLGLNQRCFTAGTGINHRLNKINLQIDYAYTRFSDLGGTHKVSLGFNM